MLGAWLIAVNCRKIFINVTLYWRVKIDKKNNEYDAHIIILPSFINKLFLFVGTYTVV